MNKNCIHIFLSTHFNRETILSFITQFVFFNALFWFYFGYECSFFGTLVLKYGELIDECLSRQFSLGCNLSMKCLLQESRQLQHGIQPRLQRKYPLPSCWIKCSPRQPCCHWNRSRKWFAFAGNMIGISFALSPAFPKNKRCRNPPTTIIQDPKI